MDGQARDDAVDPFSIGRANFHGLRGIQFIENRRQSALRKALQAQIAVRRDFADDESGFVNRRDDQAMRRAAADGDDHVAEIIGRRMKLGGFRANPIGYRAFVP